MINRLNDLSGTFDDLGKIASNLNKVTDNLNRRIDEIFLFLPEIQPFFVAGGILLGGYLLTGTLKNIVQTKSILTK